MHVYKLARTHTHPTRIHTRTQTPKKTIPARTQHIHLTSTYPLTARVVGAQQMISQPVSQHIRTQTETYTYTDNTAHKHKHRETQRERERERERETERERERERERET